MGGNCSLPDDLDNFEGTTTTTIRPNQEQFIEGRIPVVNQNPRQFDDDDPIDLPRNGGRYGQNNIDMMQRLQYNLQENIQLDVKSIGLNQVQGMNNLALMVSLNAKEIVLEDVNGKVTQRPGIDLICVIDHSGSMAGEKIKLVKRTLKHMLEFLGPQDRLCIIQFDCRCYRLTRLMRVTPENLEKYRIAIHSIQARGGTNIENGMHMAFSAIRHRKYKNPVCAIFLLSDGVDEGAEERVQETLRKNYIPDPFTIKTFGFGRDVCPRLMNEIAHMKEGQFYFVPDINIIDECFVEALGGLVSVVANNLRITVKISGPGRTKITKAYGDKWLYDSWSGIHSLYQPHILSGVTKNFIFEVNVPQDNKNPVFVTVRIEADPIDNRPKAIIEQTVQINSISEDELTKQDVMSNLMRVKGAEVFNQALQHAENGNYSQGQYLLNQAINQINYNGLTDQQSQMVKNDLALAQKMCLPGDFQNEGRHHMMQLHIVHMYQKSRGVQIYAQTDDQDKAQLVDCQYQNNIQKAYKQQTRDMKQNQQPGNNNQQYNQNQNFNNNQQNPQYGYNYNQQAQNGQNYQYNANQQNGSAQNQNQQNQQGGQNGYQYPL